MRRLGDDLFKRQNESHKSEDGASCLSIKAKFIQLLGNDIHDLLNSN